MMPTENPPYFQLDSSIISPDQRKVLHFCFTVVLFVLFLLILDQENEGFFKMRTRKMRPADKMDSSRANEKHPKSPSNFWGEYQIINAFFDEIGLMLG